MISPQGSINTNISSIIDYDRLADFLIDWGDSGFNFDITGYLVEEFKTYAYELVYERYSMEEVSAKVDECTDDFLMDDWDDILADMFDIVCSCPVCCGIIYRDNNREYIYETGRMLYGCPECGEEVLD
jgi:hypothetical protein